MRNQSAPELSALPVFFALIYAAVNLLAEPSTISLSARAASTTILAGEPLVVTVTLKNESSADVLIPAGAASFARKTIGPSGSIIESILPLPAPDEGAFLSPVTGGTAEAFRFVAHETSGIRQPGAYQMTVQYAPLQLSAALEFTVQAYDRAALTNRAYEALGPAANPLIPGHAESLSVIEAIEPEVAKPLLCDLLRRIPDEHTVALRLESIGDDQAVSCLINQLPVSSGLQQLVIQGALTRVVKRAPDSSLRDRVQKALDRAGQRDVR